MIVSTSSAEMELTGVRRAGGRADNAQSGTASSSGSTAIATISLPAGKWLLTGHVVADNSSSAAAAEPDCTIGTVWARSNLQ
jgi:hypothetical protein